MKNLILMFLLILDPGNNNEDDDSDEEFTLKVGKLDYYIRFWRCQLQEPKFPLPLLYGLTT